jgi:hypothetical protein
VVAGWDRWWRTRAVTMSLTVHLISGLFLPRWRETSCIRRYGPTRWPVAGYAYVRVSAGALSTCDSPHAKHPTRAPRTTPNRRPTHSHERQTTISIQQHCEDVRDQQQSKGAKSQLSASAQRPPAPKEKATHLPRWMEAGSSKLDSRRCCADAESGSNDTNDPNRSHKFQVKPSFSRFHVSARPRGRHRGRIACRPVGGIRFHRFLHCEDYRRFVTDGYVVLASGRVDAASLLLAHACNPFY